MQERLCKIGNATGIEYERPKHTVPRLTHIWKRERCKWISTTLLKSIVSMLLPQHPSESNTRSNQIGICLAKSKLQPSAVLLEALHCLKQKQFSLEQAWLGYGGGARVRSILWLLMSHCQEEQQRGLQNARQKGQPCHVVPFHTTSSLGLLSAGTLQQTRFTR